LSYPPAGPSHFPEWLRPASMLTRERFASTPAAAADEPVAQERAVLEFLDGDGCGSMLKRCSGTVPAPTARDPFLVSWAGPAPASSPSSWAPSPSLINPAEPAAAPHASCLRPFVDARNDYASPIFLLM